MMVAIVVVLGVVCVLLVVTLWSCFRKIDQHDEVDARHRAELTRCDATICELRNRQRL